MLQLQGDAPDYDENIEIDDNSYFNPEENDEGTVEHIVVENVQNEEDGKCIQ